MPDLKIDFTDNFPAWEEYFSSLDIDKKFDEIPEVKSDKEKTFLATKGIYSSYYTIKSTEVRLTKYRYYAPFDGSIAEVFITSTVMTLKQVLDAYHFGGGWESAGAASCFH